MFIEVHMLYVLLVTLYLESLIGRVHVEEGHAGFVLWVQFDRCIYVCVLLYFFTCCKKVIIN